MTTRFMLRRVSLVVVAAACVGLAAHGAEPPPLPKVPAECPPQLKLRAPGVKLTLVAEHPQVVTPTGLDVDRQGRVWVVCSHTHFRPQGYPGPQFDEIAVLSEPDAADRMQKRSVFYDRTAATMDLELGSDGWVYLAERSRILRVRDTDGDGRGDREEVLAVLKTESDYPHNGMAGLAWHPSGDLIFALGENMWKEWTLEAPGGVVVRGIGEGGIFRCRPDGTQLRRIAVGFWNPFGVCVTPGGDIFAAENDPGSRPPCRLLHVVEGGDYGYQRAYGEAPFHPFVCWDGELRGTLPMVCGTGEAPCGVATLGGGLIVPSWSDNRIDFFALKRRGASYGADRVELVSGSEMFRPTCLARVADGTYYLADWVFGSYPIHQRGRVWKLEIDAEQARDWLRPATPEPPNDAARQFAELNEGRATLPIDELLRLARGDDPFLARAALRALARRSDEWSGPIAIAKLSEPDRVSACLALKLARPQDVERARGFLADLSRDVQFEALRWIADERLTALAPEVERMLVRSDLDFRLFESCLAALNTLRGNARAGVDDPAMLLERVLDREAPPHVRGFALRLLSPTNAKLTVSLMKELLALPSDVSAAEVVRTLCRRPGADAARLLAEVAQDDARPLRIRAEAVVGLAAAADEHRPLLVQLAEHPSHELRNEALRAVRGAKLTADEQTRLRAIAGRYPDSAELVRAALDPTTIAVGRPTTTDVQAWRQWLGRADGDPEAGRRIFFHTRLTQCANCHKYGGRGNVVGPDLSAVAARGDATWLLQSLLEPSRDVAPQFFPTKLEMDDGTEFLGIKLRKGGSGQEVYRDLTGAERTIKTANVERREDLTTSVMPVGVLTTLTAREIRDLLAFLSQGSVVQTAGR